MFPTANKFDEFTCPGLSICDRPHCKMVHFDEDEKISSPSYDIKSPEYDVRSPGDIDDDACSSANEDDVCDYPLAEYSNSPERSVINNNNNNVCSYSPSVTAAPVLESPQRLERLSVKKPAPPPRPPPRVPSPVRAPAPDQPKVDALGRPSKRIAHPEAAKLAKVRGCSSKQRVANEPVLVSGVDGAAAAAAAAPGNLKPIIRPGMMFHLNGPPYAFRSTIVSRLFEEMKRVEQFKNAAAAVDDPDYSALARKAVRTEFNIFHRSTSVNIYRTHSASAIISIRRLMSSAATATTTAASAAAAKVVVVQQAPVQLTDQQLYQHLTKFVISRAQRIRHGFPTEFVQEDGTVDIRVCLDELPYFKPKQTKIPNMRVCDRCGTHYTMDKDGGDASRSSSRCLFHPGKFWIVDRSKQKYAFTCCGGNEESQGCLLRHTHVANNPIAKRIYTSTEDFDKPDRFPGIYAIDCEMSYTAKCLEITRVTVIDHHFSVVLESFVKPSANIVDFNTQYSGITADSLNGVETTLDDVIRSLRNFIGPDTILIGHGLDNDLRALHLCHQKVIDTSILYGRGDNPAQKYSLKTLVAKNLNKKIQKGESGHDSFEDAKACMELVLHKVNNSSSGGCGASRNVAKQAKPN